MLPATDNSTYPSLRKANSYETSHHIATVPYKAHWIIGSSPIMRQIEDVCRNDNNTNLAPPRGDAFPPLCENEGERKRP